MHRTIAVALVLFAAIPGIAQSTPSSFDLMHAKAAHECMNNSVAYIGGGQPYQGCWGSADIGAQFNAAVAYIEGLTHQTGKIVIQTGSYNTTTVMSKPYWIMVDGQFSNIVPQVSGCGIIDGAVVPPGPQLRTYTNGGWKDINIINGAKTAYGICLGGDPAGLLMPATNRSIFETFINVQVSRFTTAGYLFGNGASQNSWYGGSITHSAGDGIKLINSTPLENDNFHGTQIINGVGYGINASNCGSCDFYLYGVSIDYNVAGAINWGNGTLGIHGGHLEQKNKYIINGTASANASRISIEGTLLALTDGVSADQAFIYIGGRNANVTIGSNVIAYSPAGHTVDELVNWQSVGSGNVLDVSHYTAQTGNGNLTYLPVTQPSPNIQFASYPDFSPVNGLQSDQFVQVLRTDTVVNQEQASPPAGAAGQDICYGDRPTHSLKCSYNNRSFLPVPQVVAAGTSTLGNYSIGATSCANVVTTAAAGVLATDSVEWAYASAPSGTTDGKLILNHYVTAGNVNWMLCNPTAGALAPTGLVVNWRVIR